MLSWMLTILLFGVVIILTAVVFFGWIIFSIVRLIVGGVASLFGYRGNPRIGPPPRVAINHIVRCRTNGCQAINPVDACFCRRCGRPLPSPQRVQVRRAAVW